jgi:hypothetical protein
MFKSSILVSILAAFSLVQGTNSPSTQEARRDDTVIDRLQLLFLPSSEIVANHRRGVAQTGNSTCSNTAGFNIGSQSDLDALATCTNITGSIVINSISISSVTIPQSVTLINGDLRIDQISSLVSVTANGLKTITGTFELLNLTALQTLTAPSLTSVGGINFVILPLLQSMTLGITQAGNVRISDTQLSALTGLSLTSVGDFGVGKFISLLSNHRQQSIPAIC